MGRTGLEPVRRVELEQDRSGSLDGVFDHVHNVEVVNHNRG